MSTTQTSADHPQSRLRGDMYLRAEQRHREEMAAAAAQVNAARTSAPAPKYQQASDSRPSHVHAIETADRLRPVSAATEVVVIAPVSVASTVVAARPAVGLTAPVASESSARAPQPLLTPRRTQTEAQPGTRAAAIRATAPTVRRQWTLIPAAALGAIALVAALGTALTLSPGDGAEENTPAATAPAAPRSAVATQAAAPAATARPVVLDPSPAERLPVATATSRTTSPTVTPRPQSTVARAAARTPVAAGAAAAARALEGQIRITSTPPGARVTVDGIGRGSTPLTVSQLSFGERRIRVTQDGYASHETVVRISGDNPTRTVTVAMRRR